MARGGASEDGSCNECGSPKEIFSAEMISTINNINDKLVEVTQLILLARESFPDAVIQVGTQDGAILKLTVGKYFE